MRMISCDTHAIRKALNLSLNEMAVLCDIVQLSSNPRFGYKCTKSKTKMAGWLDINRDTVFTILKTLEAKGYIERDESACWPTQFIHDIESCQDGLAIYIKSGQTELLTAKMKEVMETGTISEPKGDENDQSEIPTTSREIRLPQSEIPTIPVGNSDSYIDSNKKNSKTTYLIFEDFRKLYPGTKRGGATEFENFKKKHKDYAQVVELLLPAVENMVQWASETAAAGGFVPEFANLQTWINQRRWETEYPVKKAVNPEIRYKTLKDKGWKFCNAEELTWVYDHQHRDSFSYTKYPSDELLGNRGSNKTKLEYKLEEEAQR